MCSLWWKSQLTLLKLWVRDCYSLLCTNLLHKLNLSYIPLSKYFLPLSTILLWSFHLSNPQKATRLFTMLRVLTFDICISIFHYLSVKYWKFSLPFTENVIWIFKLCELGFPLLYLSFVIAFYFQSKLLCATGLVSLKQVICHWFGSLNQVSMLTGLVPLNTNFVWHWLVSIIKC